VQADRARLEQAFVEMEDADKVAWVPSHGCAVVLQSDAISDFVRVCVLCLDGRVAHIHRYASTADKMHCSAPMRQHCHDVC
jgi:hypothetical protein